MTYDKPPCPGCGAASKVKTKGGGSKGLYRYVCEAVQCGAEWQQIPPHKSKADGASKIIMKTKSKREAAYKCGRCGAKKLGHTCPHTTPHSSQVDTIALVPLGEAASSESMPDDLPPLSLFRQPLPFSKLTSERLAN